MQVNALEKNLPTRIILIIGTILMTLCLAWGYGNPEEPANNPKPDDIKNRIYDEPNMPISTQYPVSLTASTTCSGEGCGLYFKFPDGALDSAKVHIFLPKGAATAAAQEKFVTGPHGLMESNGWKNDGESCDTGSFPYAWIRKIISFSDRSNDGMVGKVLMGETNGQAVQLTLYYPSDMGKEFLEGAKVILENLYFKSDQLPLRKAP
jgi:hypothetical protein